MDNEDLMYADVMSEYLKELILNFDSERPNPDVHEKALLTGLENIIEALDKIVILEQIYRDELEEAHTDDRY